MPESVDIVIIGTGGHAKVVAEAAVMDGRYRLAGFVNTEKAGPPFLGYQVRADASDFSVQHFIVAIGDNNVRARVFDEMKERGMIPVNVIHPKALVSPSVNVGSGTLVVQGAILNPFARVGENCIINTGAIIEHDCEIEDHVHVAPGCRLAGNVRVGERTLLGIGVTVIPGVSIGQRSMLGAGAVVIANIDNDVTALGVPAKTLQRLHVGRVTKSGSDF